MVCLYLGRLEREAVVISKQDTRLQSMQLIGVNKQPTVFSICRHNSHLNQKIAGISKELKHSLPPPQVSHCTIYIDIYR